MDRSAFLASALAGTTALCLGGVAQAEVIYQQDFEGVTPPAVPTGSGGWTTGGTNTGAGGSIDYSITTQAGAGTPGNALVMEGDLTNAASYFYVQWRETFTPAVDLSGVTAEEIYVTFDIKVDDWNDQATNPQVQIRIGNASSEDAVNASATEGAFSTVTISLADFEELDINGGGPWFFQVQPQSGLGYAGLNGQEQRYTWTIDNIEMAVVPEPASLLFIGAGVLALAGRRVGRRDA